MDLGLEALSKITIFSKYAKYLPELKRRETWDEIVDRYEAMMVKKYPNLEEQIKLIIAACTEVKVAEKAKDVALRVSLKEDELNEGVRDWLKALKVKFNSLLRSVKVWGKAYDKQFAIIKSLAGVK